MSWRDRPYSDGNADGGRRGGLGGDWSGSRPTLDNPMSWSLPIGRYLDVNVRVHVIFLVFIVIQLLVSAGSPDAADRVPLAMGLTAGLLAALFIVVLLHEYGHCLACRSTGGDAHEILMWPLGGLAMCNPPNRWTAHLITVAGGPLVNVAICVLLAPILGLATGQWWGVAIPNPINPGAGLYSPQVAGSIVLVGLFLVNYVSLLLLLFNLLPIFPLDGGRLLQAFLWSKQGYVRSMRISVRVGYFGALALGIAAFPLGNFMLFAIALFGGLTCYQTYRQLQFTQEMMGFDDDEYVLTAAAVEEPEPAVSARAQRRAERAAKREREEAEEVDRILQKIHDEGMDALTAGEKRLLERFRRRKQQDSRSGK